MTGLERNSDIVRMASYAPLFVDVHDRRWNPDAIVFDAAHSYGTPSYYVQKLFAQNRADVILPAEFNVNSTPAPAVKGGIGLGTWLTQAEYKEIEVTQGGQALYRSDFAHGAPDWRPLRGDWKLVEGAYRQSGGEQDRRALLVSPALADASDYTIHLKARKLGGAEAPLAATIRLEGVDSLDSTGQAITLTSNSTEDENSFAQPAKVAPVSPRISGIAPRFTYTFPARSLTALR
jgi:alpha-L-arabinofuranosidase